MTPAQSSAAPCDESQTMQAQPDDFWSAMAIDLDWVEGHATLRELVESSDAVVLGRFTSIEEGDVVRGDAPEDVFTETRFRLDVARAWGVAAGQRTFDYQQAVVPLALLEAPLPSEPALVLARSRRGEAGEFSLVNGYGVWAATPRAAVDAPVNAQPPADGRYAEEMAQFDSFDEWVSWVESVLAQAGE